VVGRRAKKVKLIVPVNGPPPVEHIARVGTFIPAIPDEHAPRDACPREPAGRFPEGVPQGITSPVNALSPLQGSVSAINEFWKHDHVQAAQRPLVPRLPHDSQIESQTESYGFHAITLLCAWVPSTEGEIESPGVSFAPGLSSPAL
jgi:hypothetical protein